MPAAFDGEYLLLVTSLADNLKDVRKFQELYGPVKFKLTDIANLEAGLIQHYHPVIEPSLTAKTHLDVEQGDASGGQATDVGEASELAAFVNEMIRNAIKMNASDIHVAPSKKVSRVSFRVNGKLINMADTHRIRQSNHIKVINRIKSMCSPQIDVTQLLIPLDGAFEYDDGTNQIDCRVNILPDIKGQKAALRLHYYTSPLKTLDNIGFLEEDLEQIRKLLEIPAGMFLVTGPTGSGKTTTLYACLLTYDAERENILTVEDPVEVKVDGFTQIQLRRSENERVDLTFDKVLRAMLRQDPDIILVGEIRDLETARVAVEASQTGHKVFSTLHTKSSISTVNRMKTMNIDQLALLSEMVVIIAQRLVGVSCPHCIVPHELTEQERRILNPEETDYLSGGTLQRSTGCPHCHATGISGRTVVAEFLIFDDDVRDYLSIQHGLKETKKFLREEKGFHSMWEKGLKLVRNGMITVQELSNTISADDRR